MKVRTTLAAFAAAIAAYAAPAHGGVLPNGWTVTPAGTLTPLGTMPLHMSLDRTGRWIAVTNAGYARLSLTIVDAATGSIADSKTLGGAFYGVAFSHDDQTVYASTAAKDGVERFAFDAAKGTLRDLGPWTLAAGDVWTAGLAISPDDGTVYVAANLADELYAVDAKSGMVRWSAPTGTQPYAVALSPDGKRAYVSDWAGAAVSIIDTATGLKVADVAVAAHPNALAVAPDGSTVYVACANGDDVDAIDTTTDAVRAIDAGLWPHAAEGTTPNGLALSPDARTLYVADAGDDAVAVIDVSGSPRLAGGIPVGWYVTDVAASADGKWVYALDGNGTNGHPNPLFQHGDVDANKDDTYYIGSLMTGDLERIRTPGASSLKDGLATARSVAEPKSYFAFPAHDAIKHVVYVVKENRTYDEVLGDDRRGNGDASLAIFGKRITPNIHRLADDFALLDNFEENSFVSADGHNWVNAAYATDYVEKLWPADYAGRDRPYDFEGTAASNPSAGYIWDDAIAHGRTVRDYGEFVKQGPLPSVGDVPSLAGHVDPRYRGWDLKYSDQSRIDEWEREFAQFERNGDLPDLEIVYLPDDHTGAVSPGYRTPYAMLASNDYAVGRLVDTLSHSRYWKDTVVFVVEDDSQAGPDHVSAQRAEALVAGGPIRRGVVDHTQYTQCSVLLTIEILLGLPPMSQFDADATPMMGLIAAKPDLRPWRASHPNVDIGKTNASHAPGAQASLRLDLREADASNAALFDQILFEYGATLRRSSQGAVRHGG
jgi:YVTN family beta-propeller protein